MKKSVKVLALAMVVLMLSLSLTACFNRLSGEYEHESLLGDSSYTFKGNKFTYNYGSIEIEGTYKIEDDKIIFELDEDVDDLTKALFDEKCDFEKTDDGIKIDGVEYEKVD